MRRRRHAAEDLWQLYNIVSAGDLTTATTMRKIAKDNAAGGKDSERIKVRRGLEQPPPRKQTQGVRKIGS
jgi:stalled ribosome rescue protein Dom34